MTEDLRERIKMLQRRAENLQRQKAQAEGSLNSALDRLLTEFDCDMEQATRKLESIQLAIDHTQSELTSKLKEFEGRWNEK